MPRPSSTRRKFKVSRLPSYATVIALTIVVLFPFWLFSSSSSSTTKTSTGLSRFRNIGGRNILSGSSSRSSSSTTEKNQYRIAFVIPFIGKGPEAIPPYLELFCSAAAGSASLADFLLVHNGVLSGYQGEACPPNVHFISFTNMDEFSHQLIRVMDRTDEDDILVGSKKKLAKVLSQHIVNYPYVLVEFKPALGHIFSEYLEGYSHWGYSDLDIMFGDLDRWITPEELTDYDIVTYGFGDQERLYLRGQLTFHKNEDRLNQLWRGCDYLSRMDKRFADVLSGEKHMHFESAEGCYSSVILKQNDIKVKYAVKAFTDVEESDTANSHGLYVGMGANHDRTVVYKARSKAHGKELATVSDTWFETKGTIYSDRSKPLQWETGKMERLEFKEKKGVQCMFWAYPKYQSRLCIDNVKSSDTVFWLDGELYKQKHETATFPSNVATAPFFHFQEWKRYYRPSQLAAFHRSSGARTFVLSKEGAIPIRSEEESSYGEKIAVPTIASPLGIKLQEWRGVKANERKQLPSRSYCLRSGPRKFPPRPPAPQCQVLVSWRDREVVDIISGAPAWNYKQIGVNSEVTLALTLQISAEQAKDRSTVEGLLDLITLYINRWQGQPSVLVLHVAGATPELISILRVRLGPDSDLSYGLETCLVAAIFHKENDFVSRKALLNMAIDAAPTRWVISGFELERGVVMSHDTAFFAHRTSRIHEDLPGNVFLIPQFGYSATKREGGEDEENQFTIRGLWHAKEEGALEALHKFEEGNCDGEDYVDDKDVFGPVVDLWWQLTEPFLSGEKVVVDDNLLTKRALAIDDIQLSMIMLLTEAKHYDLFAMDTSPILLTDNLGPLSGVPTVELVREVEEFGGKQCYNALRLAQLATFGYNVNVMAGAFAASTEDTRKVAFSRTVSEDALGSSRCDGCFLFDEKHEDILEDISKDERERPAKAALLWDKPLESQLLQGHT